MLPGGHGSEKLTIKSFGSPVKTINLVIRLRKHCLYKYEYLLDGVDCILNFLKQCIFYFLHFYAWPKITSIKRYARM